jgi:ribosomal protein L40E
MTDRGAAGDDPRGRECHACGRSLPPNAAFCRSCGTKYEPPSEPDPPEPGEADETQVDEPRPEEDEAAPSCQKCGAALPAKAAFCRSCGSPVAAAPPPPPPPTPPKAAPPSPPPPVPPLPAKSRRSVLPFVLGALVLLAGAGVAAAILLSKESNSSETLTKVEQSAALEAEAAFEEETAEAEEVDSEEVESVTPRGFPTVSRGQMNEEISSLLRDYHEDVVEEDFQGAWALLSNRKRQQDLAEYGYRKWAAAQASLTPYLRPYELEASVVALEDEGVARVVVTGMEWDKPGAPCYEWSGLTWVKYEREVWTYDPGYSTTPDRRAVWQPRSDRLLGADCAE